MILVVDNGSSYTSRLIDCLSRCGVSYHVSLPGGAQPEPYSHYVLSGRRRNDNAMNAYNTRIIRYALEHGRPLLGICYGAEMMALAGGGTIRQMGSGCYGDIEVRITQDNPLCSDTVKVYESHRYEIARIPPRLVSVGSSSLCRYEIIRYDNTLAFGVQFHPEMTSDGQEMIRRFAAFPA